MPWARETFAGIRARRTSLSSFSLHPYTNQRLVEHPVAILLGMNHPVRQFVSDLYHLGRDLVATRSVPGIASLRRGLPVFEEYLGRLFELELAATFVRAGATHLELRKDTPDLAVQLNSLLLHIEARHRGVWGARAAAAAIYPPVDALGAFSVRVSPDTKPMDFARTVSNVMAAEYDKSLGSAFTVKGRGYAIAFEPGPECTVRVTFDSAGDDWQSELQKMVHDSIEEKIGQLRGRESAPASKAIIALDCRSLVPVVQRSLAERYRDLTAQARQIRDGVLAQVRSELDMNLDVSAVLLWLRSDIDHAEAVNPDWRARSVASASVAVVGRKSLEIARTEARLAEAVAVAVQD
jgi:hypothetical protein